MKLIATLMAALVWCGTVGADVSYRCEGLNKIKAKTPDGKGEAVEEQEFVLVLRDDGRAFVEDVMGTWTATRKGAVVELDGTLIAAEIFGPDAEVKKFRIIVDTLKKTYKLDFKVRAGVYSWNEKARGTIR